MKTSHCALAIFALLNLCFGSLVHAQSKANTLGKLGKPIFAIEGDEVGKDTITKLFKPFVDLVTEPGLVVVDIEETTISTDILRNNTADGEKVVYNRLSNIRFVSDPKKKAMHFVKVFDDDDSFKEGYQEPTASGPDAALQAREIMLKHRRNPKFVSGAMIFHNDKYYGKKLFENAWIELPEKTAKRVSGFAAMQHMPFKTASDVVYGSLSPAQTLENYHDPKIMKVRRIEVFEDGSHRVVWSLLNGKLEREILFSNDKDMLPVSLEDWLMDRETEEGEPGFEKGRMRLLSRTLTQWEEDPQDRKRISKVYAKYSGRNPRAGTIVSNFFYQWRDPDPKLDYFSPDTLGLVLPITSQQTRTFEAGAKRGQK